MSFKHHRKYFQTPKIYQKSYPVVSFCNWVGFRISLSREGAIFRDEIENYFSCSPLARRYIEIIIGPFSYFKTRAICNCYSCALRREQYAIVILVFRDKIETLENHNSRTNEAESRQEFLGLRILADPPYLGLSPKKLFFGCFP